MMVITFATGSQSDDGGGPLRSAAEAVTVLDFGAKGDGVTPDNAAIARAIVASCSRPNRGQIHFPAGDYAVAANAPITIPCPGIALVGNGGGAQQRGGTRFVIVGSGREPIFRFAAPVRPGDRYFYGGAIRDIAFLFRDNSMASQPQSGPAVRFDHCWGCLVENVFVAGAQNAFWVYAGFHIHFHDVFVTQAVSNGYAFTFSGDTSGKNCNADIGNCTTRLDVVDLTDFHVDEALSGHVVPGGCIHVTGFVATVWVRNGTCNQTHIAVKTDCPRELSHDIGTCPQFIDLYRLESEINAAGDPGDSACILALDIVHFHASAYQCYGYGPPDNLMVFRDANDSGSAHVELDNPYIANARHDCIIDSVLDFKLSGGDVIGCGTEGTTHAGARHAGLHISARPSSHVSKGATIVNGTNFCTGYKEKAETSMVGVRIDEGIDYASIQNNIFRGCIKGVIMPPTRNTTNIVTGNTPE
ncbi:glycosyl hydrolase family 28-related protein [Gluconacetobacter takamatsuzukensis]|uniref:Rhamnogalacturonase A/B/Epimerase-like pectate lyase domain-containing protein n=1 Tax=Gluconacetobacter takamatsuzukensis TaxID=1286190 RepID=A0A7W4KDB6_9PROT|nr:glycosyl hydrolase family 28-related protein [Gluconacetobacter takamatsuzukensis]MBB2204859.1 hypothetical protein [Gluconacetobacter takamatsuzukensis]